MLRRILFALLLLCAAPSVWAACAPSQPGSAIWQCDYKDEAYAKAQGGVKADGASTTQECTALAGSPNGGVTLSGATDNGTMVTATFQCKYSNGNLAGNIQIWAYFNAVCPSGRTFNGTTKKCELSCPGGYTEDPYNPGQCLDQDKCEARNAEYDEGPKVFMGSPPACAGGCAFQHGGTTTTVFGGQTVTNTVHSRYSGASCAPDNKPKPLPEDEDGQCTAAPNGQTMCIKPDGTQCFTASTGRQICWTPNSTGEKPDGNVLQVRNNNANPPSVPSTTPPPGSTFTQTTTNSVTTNTVVQSITNYTTSTGGPAGPTNTGEPGGNLTPGTGTPGTGGNGTPGSATGGETCATPPSCTNPSENATECAKVQQIWWLRCKGPDVTGGEHCEAVPACTGHATDCALFKGQWELRCGGKAEMAALADQLQADLDAMNASANETPGEVGSTLPNNGDPFGNGSRETRGNNWLLDKIDDTGFFTASADCPALPSFSVSGTSIPLTLGPICSILVNLGALVMGLAYFLAFRIMAGAK